MTASHRPRHKPATSMPAMIRRHQLPVFLIGSIILGSLSTTVQAGIRQSGPDSANPHSRSTRQGILTKSTSPETHQRHVAASAAPRPCHRWIRRTHASGSDRRPGLRHYSHRPGVRRHLPTPSVPVDADLDHRRSGPVLPGGGAAGDGRRDPPATLLMRSEQHEFAKQHAGELQDDVIDFLLRPTSRSHLPNPSE